MIQPHLLKVILPLLCAAAMLAAPGPVFAQTSVTLEWDPSPAPEVTGYVVSWGQSTFTSAIDVGNATRWTVEGLEPHQRYIFTVQAYDKNRRFSAPAGAVSNDGLIVRPAGLLAPGSHDRPSIFWQHDTTGTLMTWHMNGTSVVDTRPLSIPAVPDTRWKIKATGDFNGDGHTDVLWRHQDEGWLAVWFLRHNLVIGTEYLSLNRVADPNWRIRGAGDLDGDGFADIVWQHASGGLAVWTMRGAIVTSTLPLSLPGGGSWQIRGVADVNGDRRSDLIWQDDDGRLAVWLMRGPNVVLTILLSIPAVGDTNWRIQAAGDVDGSGRAAVLWRHEVSGHVAIWRLVGHIVTLTTYLDPDRVHDLDWKIVGSR
jgi:hypothetical protein